MSELAGRIREALDGATPGEWRVAADERTVYVVGHGPIVGAAAEPRDAFLIANAPTLLTEALAEIERLHRAGSSDRAVAVLRQRLAKSEWIVCAEVARILNEYAPGVPS